MITKNLETDDLLKRMENIVKRTMKGYKTDFYKWDIEYIKKKVSEHKPFSFLWIVRELGTHVVTQDGSEDSKNYLHAIRANWSEYKEYKITFDRDFKWSIENVKRK